MTTDKSAISAASVDFGRMTYISPAAVLLPSSEHDIAALIKSSFHSPGRPFTVAARGHGHSIHGQAAAGGGVVVEMRSMASGKGRLTVFPSGGDPPYVDAGGEQFWIDVLRETLRHGLTPRSWTDYLHLTVGGTLSVAGVSGQAFRHGPQISNVIHLEVITGKGEIVNCSKNENEDLFHAVLGGLGQFGVITRARIVLEPAPERARWVRVMYTDFAKFTNDQELLMSLEKKGFDYVEGSLFLTQSPIASWRSTFFSDSDLRRIIALAQREGHGVLYCLEVVLYYSGKAEVADKDTKALLAMLSFRSGFVFSNDVTYIGFLDRVHQGELMLRKKGLWGIPHPWLNIFVPRSRMNDIDLGVFKGLMKHKDPMGPILIYGHNRTKWDARMSAVIPEEEEVFYMVGFLRSAVGEWRHLEAQNIEILRFCEQQGIKMKQYIPRFSTQEDWKKHFGEKWSLFLERKKRYDPLLILSPGQGIFNSLVRDA